ncbi:MAG TPA: hypothetical protein VFE14_09030 [Micromonosporaceae bacterium]|nr:hypothetical protein [Micromonosporaceae bacterium]
MDHATRDSNARRRWIGWAAGLLGAGALAGGLLATALPATADPSSPSASASQAPGQDGTGTANRAGGQRPDETLLTGNDAAKARAAALKALPGATIDRVETDADGAVYEAHVTKSDGTKATVKFDKDFNVVAVEAGMGSHK